MTKIEFETLYWHEIDNLGIPQTFYDTFVRGLVHRDFNDNMKAELFDLLLTLPKATKIMLKIDE